MTRSVTSPTPAYVLHTIKALLTPIAADVLQSLILRLWYHCDLPEGEKNRATESFSHYPEDLVCAAYHYVMRLPVTSSDELIGNMISFMEPELNYRRQRYMHLLSLQQEGAQYAHA